ncbi:MAG: hypothetical protein Tp118SUR00d2C21406231_17 [Prokaryotic dsDNA virus sp.]|nr:MAG: hypothetical protein Tp125DCM00d2C40298531_36 [Prokaryotic dsDNA virus sp.]QDP53137.1 MAG: hypothetical protein Tp118SUR00d2C21406231_17 [Prokaryotic dsDNA virus sp.]|tara:strand:+ start:13672 stop:14013 length:342 start_codon:yes stop_codon:yes gene_type:complete
MTITKINVQTGTVTTLDEAAPSYVTPEQALEQGRAAMVASPMQIRLALLAIGRLAEVEAIVAAASETVQIAWDRATQFPRNSPTIAALAPAADPPFSATDIDDLFRAAMQIEA